MANKKPSARKKGARIKVAMISEGLNKKGKRTNYTKTTTVNVRTQQTENKGKLLLKKYDPFAWNEATGRPGAKVDFKQKKVAK